MYNAEFKHTFLSSKHYANATKQAMILMFKCIAHAERKLQKDLCHFQENELIEALEGIGLTNMQMLQNYMTLCSDYVDFAIGRGVSVHRRNPFRYIRARDFLLLFLANAKTIFSREDLFRMAHKAPNYQNGALLALIFDGANVRDQYREISSIQNDHLQCEKLAISLPSRTLHVSDDTCRLIKKAASQDEYLSIQGNYVHRYPLARSPYVFKGMRGNPQASVSLFQKRLNRLSDYYDSPALNATNIAYSGLVYHTKQAVENGENWDAALQKVTTRFGFHESSTSRSLLKQRVQKHLEENSVA